MTREEAITTLEEMYDSFDGIHETTNGDIGYEQMTAIDMAIEALKANDEINEMNREIIKDILKMMPTAYLLEALGVATFEELMESADRPHGEWAFNPTEIVRCKDCRYAGECHKSVQYTQNEQNTVNIGYSPIEWCSRGERREE